MSRQPTNVNWGESACVDINESWICDVSAPIALNDVCQSHYVRKKQFYLRKPCSKLIATVIFLHYGMDEWCGVVVAV